MSGNAKYQQGLRAGRMLKALNQIVPGKRKCLNDEEIVQPEIKRHQPQLKHSCDKIQDPQPSRTSNSEHFMYLECDTLCIDKDEMHLLSVLSIPILPEVKSLSMSDLTQDNEIGVSIHRKYSSNIVFNEKHKDQDFVKQAWIWCLPYRDDNSQDHIKTIAAPKTFMKSLSLSNSVQICSKLKSLSFSDLTYDQQLPKIIRRCNSAMESLTTSKDCYSDYDIGVECNIMPLNNNNNHEDTSDCGECQVFYGDMDEGRKRRRIRKPSEWSRNKAKELRMKGEEYIGYRKPAGEKAHHDTLRPARVIGETCKSKFCEKSKLRSCSKFDEETRKKIHYRFWKILNWDQRKIFVNSLVKRGATGRKTVKDKSRREGTLRYFLPITANGDETVQVCRDMFLNTLSLGSFTVQSWIKSAEFGMSRNKQLLNDSKVVTPNAAAVAKAFTLDTFFERLPKLPAHYGRQDSNKLYLEPTYKTVTDLYKTYKEYCRSKDVTPVSRYTFDHKFREKNLSLLILKKDMCDTCASYLAGNLDEADYQLHIFKKNRARQEKTDDKVKAANGEFILLTMDLESVKVCPYLTASALYFKTKLTCHNFTVYNLTTHQCTCYWFNETTADLTSNTFASFLIDFLERHCLPRKLPVIIFSDGCTYQNRNVILANALLNLSKVHKVTIIQKFLIPGHTQMECDSVHSAIERKLKNREIHLPSDYSTVTKEARKEPPYEVVEIDHDFVKNFTDAEKVYKSMRPGRKVGDPQVTDIRAIKYTPDSKIQIKLDFDDEWVDLPQRQKLLSHEVVYENLHSEPIPITSTKYNHLQQLKTVIPKDCHAFYDNLPKN